MAQKSISDHLIETIRERSDLVAIVSEHLSLKKTGQNFTGLCPFHEEKTSSFVVNPVKQFFHCFGCGEGGDVFHFIGKMSGISFPEAIRALADRGGIPLPEEDGPLGGVSRTESEEIFAVNEAAAAYFHHNLLDRPEGKPALAYLNTRGLTLDTIRDFSIGFALPAWDDLVKALAKQFSIALLEKAGLVSKKTGASVSAQGKAAGYDRFRNRVLFPIRTRQGKVAGFGGRVLDDGMPKYLNTSETAVFTKGKILFGLDRSKVFGADPLIIVEGYLDVISAAQAGISNVVATLGTALTEAHLRLIRRLTEKVILVFDGDEAGVRAALRTAPLLIDQEIAAQIVTLPPGKDPDLLIREMGKPAFLAELEKGKPIVDFAITQSLKKSSLKQVEDKMRVMRQIAPLIDRLRSQIEKSHYLKVLSDTLLLREEDVRTEFIRLTQTEKKIPSKTQAPAVIEKQERIPDEEEKILMLLIQGYLEPEVLNDYFSLDDFTHPLLNAVIAHYWDAEGNKWCNRTKGMSPKDQASHSLISRLSVSEVDAELVKQIEEDCMNVLHRKKFDRERNAIEYQLKQVAGDSEVKKVLMKKIYDLKQKSSHLAGSH